MGVCGSRISDRTFSRSESGEGRGGNEHRTFEMAKGAGFWREEEEGESSSVSLAGWEHISANYNFIKIYVNYIKKSSKFIKKITHVDDMMINNLIKYLVQIRLRL